MSASDGAHLYIGLLHNLNYKLSLSIAGCKNCKNTHRYCWYRLRFLQFFRSPLA